MVKYVKYLDIKKEYYILVPLNKKALEDLYRYKIYKKHCQEDECIIKDTFKAMIFHEDTYYEMESMLFDYINVECDIIINMYEEAIVENNQLEKVLLLTNSLLESSKDENFIKFATEFKSLVELAIKKKTVIGFYF